jgi:Flp pilus assembly pilin Flp
MVLLRRRNAMKEPRKPMVRPLNNEKGLEVMEAGLYAVLIIVASLVAMTAVGPAIAGAWAAIAAAV